MQVFTDLFPICSCSIILNRWDALYIPSINLNWIKSSSIVCPSGPSFSNSQYQLVDDVDILWFVRQFLVSSIWDSFFRTRPTFSWTSYFFLWSDFFFKCPALQVCGIHHSGNFYYRLASSCSWKEIRNFIFSSFSLLFSSVLVLALAAKHRCTFYGLNRTKLHTYAKLNSFN